MHKHKHMRNVRYLSLLLGLWPVDDFKTNWRIRRYIRVFYRKFVKTFFYIFVLSAAINIYFFRNNAQKLLDLLTVMFALYTSIIKIHICKNQSANLVNCIYETEKKLYLSPNKHEYEAIYNTHIKIHYFMNKLTIFLVIMVYIAYLSFPIMEEKFSGINEMDRIMPIDVWLPFDKNKHYRFAYFVQFIGMFTVVTYVGCPDMFIVGMLIFALGQIKILQKKLTDFTKKTQDIVEAHSNIPKEYAVDICIQECVKHHRQIIA